MQQLMSLWSALDVRRRVVVGLTTIAVFAAVMGMARMASNPAVSLLYAGLDSGAAGEVVRALEQRGAVYEVRGDAIYVDARERDTLRMTLAAEGLPANGASGYELLDSLSGFGTTSQMFDAAYWRAKEGELARTIVASPQIRAARVHLSSVQAQPFRRENRPTASVTVTTVQGFLPETQAMALKYLVASAVSGLSPEDVAIIDSTGGLIKTGEDAAAPSAAGDTRAAELKRNVERLLEARVGPGNVMVEVSVDTVTEREQITERRFDPESRVAISTDTEERSTSESGSGGNGVTVASNLPTGDAAGTSSSQSSNSETRERVNFEVSETQREVLRSPGAVRRITVAVLVDGLRVPGADGAEAWQPRSEEEMGALRDLVASVVGFDEARGDVITLKSLEFEPIAAVEEGAEPSLFAALDLMSLIQIAVLALVALVLGLFVLRPILTSRTARVTAPASGGALPAPAPDAERAGETRVLTGEIDDGDDLPSGLPVVSRDDGTLPDTAEADPVLRLRKLIEERQEETVEILRSWMEDREETV